MSSDRDPRRSFNTERGSKLNSQRIGLLKTAYEEGRKALDDQIAELDAMKQRTVQYMAFVASATAFLVGSALSADRVRSATFLKWATSATAVSILALVFLTFILLSIVWSPTGKKWLGRALWNFQVKPQVLVEKWIAPELGAADAEEFYEDLALHYGDKLEENEKNLSQIRRWYWLVIVAGGLQVVLWVWVVWRFA